MALLIALSAALLASGAQSFDWPGVALKFLQRHDVPCRAVTKMDSVVGAEIATCDDGREWALFWLENEVAFIDPQSRRPYRWRAEVNRAHPQLYDGVRVKLPISGNSAP
jgi:hypothetical protein